MSKVCTLCQKGPSAGNNRSHSNRATKRRYLPNLIEKNYYCEETDTSHRMKVCTQCNRSIARSGSAYIKKMRAKMAA